MNKFTATLSAIALTALVAPAASASTLIDNFTTGAQHVQDLPGAHGNSSEVAAAGALGGYRDMEVQTDLNETEASELRVFTSGGGILTFSNIFGASGQGLIVYDGQDGSASSAGGINTTGLGGIDLTAGGSQNAFFFEILGADAALQITVGVVDMLGVISTYTEILTSTIDPLLKFTQFTGSADFTNVGALIFGVASLSPNLDGALGSISVVPLPASALLLLGGLGGLGGISAAKRRRRRKA
jgi:hypothetical protein